MGQHIGLALVLVLAGGCNCHGDGCNEDWKTAGQSSALEVSLRIAWPLICIWIWYKENIVRHMVHATYNCQYIDLTAFLLQCYECNSMDEKGSCSDTESGELSRCGPGAKGCFISKGGNSNLIEGNIWWRHCMDQAARAALSAGVVFQTW